MLVWGLCGLPHIFHSLFNKTQNSPNQNNYQFSMLILALLLNREWIDLEISLTRHSVCPPSTSIQTSLLPQASYNYPSSPSSSSHAAPLPSCIRPFSVTIHYFDGSQRKNQTEKWAILWLSEVGPIFGVVFFFFRFLSHSLCVFLSLSFIFLFSQFLAHFI